MLQEVAGQQVWTTQSGMGQTRLFLHCSLAQSDSLFALADAMRPAQNIFFDLPGYGRSAPWTGAVYHTDAFNIATRLIDGPTHLVGHSFGATVALRLAVERPECVSRLTLIEPVLFAAAAGTNDHTAHASAFEPFVKAYAAGDVERMSEVFVNLWGTGVPWVALPERMRQRIMAQIHLIPAAAPALEEDAHGILDGLARVTCHVDMIEGTQSPAVIAAILDRLERGLPQAKRHVIKGAGHMAPITHPTEVAKAIGADCGLSV